jgi:hypothetical protein
MDSVAVFGESEYRNIASAFLQAGIRLHLHRRARYYQVITIGLRYYGPNHKIDAAGLHMHVYSM